MKVKPRYFANQNPDFLSDMADSIQDAWVSEDESEPVVEQEEEKQNEFMSGTEIDSRKNLGLQMCRHVNKKHLRSNMQQLKPRQRQRKRRKVCPLRNQEKQLLWRIEPIPQWQIRGRLRQQLEKFHPESLSVQGETNELRRILLQWEDGKKNPEIARAQAYMYSLENNYGESPFAIATSSESDKDVIDRLEAVCGHNDFYLYFAHVERRFTSRRMDEYGLPRAWRGYRSTGRYGHSDDDDSSDEEDYDLYEDEEYAEPDVTLILTHFTDRNGLGPFHSFDLSYDDSDFQFIKEENFDDEEPEDEDFDCWILTEVYTRTVRSPFNIS